MSLLSSRRSLATAALTAFFVLLAGGLAHADTVHNDVEASAETVTIAAGESATVRFDVVETGGTCDPAIGNPLVLTFNVPAGVTATPPSLTFTKCRNNPTEDNRQSATFTSSTPGEYNITATAADVGGSYNTVPAAFKLVVTEAPVEDDDQDDDGTPDDDDNCPTQPNEDQADADNDGIGDVCDENAYAPEIDVQAGDANGLEGTPGNPTTVGSFSDQDGDTLTLSKGATDAGELTDKGDGSFTWSHTTTDDDSGSVTVTASDGEHTTSQTFAWTAVNVAPVIESVTATRTDACSVSVSAPFADQGTDDTHDASIDWGDGNTTTVDPATTPVSGTHTYTSNGTFTIGVTVNDDDDGTHSVDAPSTFATQNTPSALLQPINAAGTRSIFKLGSTIPVKITVTGCDGQAVTTLTPTVTITKLDSTPDGGTTESPATATATNGLTMRFSDGIYIYNLSTKLSQQYGTALTAGSYRITVSDPSFVAPTSALVELKK